MLKNLVVMFYLFEVQVIDLVNSGKYELTECSEDEKIKCGDKNLYCCSSEICCTEYERSTLRDHGYFSPKFVIISLPSILQKHSFEINLITVYILKLMLY